MLRVKEKDEMINSKLKFRQSDISDDSDSNLLRNRKSGVNSNTDSIKF